jgi:Protein of unknown function (DUF3048).
MAITVFPTAGRKITFARHLPYNTDMLRKTFLFTLLLLITACTNSEAVQPTHTEAVLPIISTPSLATTTPTATSSPQPRLALVSYGPESEDFPADVNPLTGREVADPFLLKLPAVLVSISNMPVTARPQAGPGFAQWVYELYIGEGTTRFLNVFYGDFPRAIPNVNGGCKVRDEIIHPKGNWIGNRVWLDENENGQQDAWEVGVGGACVLLYRNGNNEQFWLTSTDSNGYYFLDFPKDNTGRQLDGNYELRFETSNAYKFTTPNVGNDDTDSDVDPLTKQISNFQLNDTDLSLDAGLILSEKPIPTPNPVVTGTPPNWYVPSEPYVGPIRSGRLTYNQIGRMFPNSCLVYASAAWDIGEMLDACQIVYGVDKTTPNSALLTVTRLRELAEKSLNPKQSVNYSGNLFSDYVPQGGKLANTINVFYHAYTQSAWQYDPISQTYLRWTDLSDGTGTLIPATDRLTQRQMSFENVIVIFAEHHRYRHNQLEIDFTMGQKNYAYLFRDGQAFKIFWSTENRDWEKKTGLVRPMHFMDAPGNLVPLHPGRTWFHIVTPFSSVTDQGDGNWLVNFVQPYDPEDTPSP